ncbi:MAG: hypothetical protein ABH878_01610 [bacterium]
MNENNQTIRDEPIVSEEIITNEEQLREEGKIAAILAYVPLLCFYALMLKRDNPYAYHHGKQGLALFLIELVAIALRWDVVWNLLLMLCAAVAIWGMVTALRGEQFRLPIISDWLDHF